MHLGHDTMLSVTLPVENGIVKYSAAASGEGAISSAIMRAIRNQINAKSATGRPSSPTTEARSGSSANSAVTPAPTTTAEAWTGRLCGGWKKPLDLDVGDQIYKMDSIPREERNRHDSVIKNGTDAGVTIHVYPMRMSQWAAAVKFFKMLAGTEGLRASDYDGVSCGAMLPQMTDIRSGCSKWFYIPREGAGVRSRRKAVVAICTVSHDESDVEMLRCDLDVVVAFTIVLVLS